MKWTNKQEFQLRAGGEGFRIRRTEEPRESGGGPNDGLQDRTVVLDDRAEAKAIVPRRHGRAIRSHKG